MSLLGLNQIHMHLILYILKLIGKQLIYFIIFLNRSYKMGNTIVAGSTDPSRNP